MSRRLVSSISDRGRALHVRLIIDELRAIAHLEPSFDDASGQARHRLLITGAWLIH